MILFITYLLNLFDLFMSRLYVNRYGISVEGNPIGRWLFTNNIAWVVKIFGVGSLLTVLGICIRKRPKYAWTTYVLFTVYALLAVYHLILIVFIYV